jgi:hypothetical protein
MTDRDRLDLLAELVALWDAADADLVALAYEGDDRDLLTGRLLGHAEARTVIVRHLTKGTP